MPQVPRANALKIAAWINSLSVDKPAEVIGAARQ